jgi:predicted metal-dependent RNase
MQINTQPCRRATINHLTQRSTTMRQATANEFSPRALTRAVHAGGEVPRSRFAHPPGDADGGVLLSFHGAAQGVTGSCFLLRATGLRILVDCGLYQGPHEFAAGNSAPFGFDPATIDYLLLSHAHLDHCGRIPLLVKRGFRGEIIATSATRELTRLILLDCAHLQEEDAKRAQRFAHRRGKEAAEALYTIADAMWSFDRFGVTAQYDQPIALNERLRVRFIDAGHILGSASIVIELAIDGVIRRLVFSGDLGSNGHAILRNPHLPPPADCVVMETRAQPGSALLPSRGCGWRPTAETASGLPRLSDGDLGDRDHAAPCGVLR